MSSRAYKASSSNCSPCSKQFYTAESSYKAPYSIPGPYSTSRLPVILSGLNSSTHEEMALLRDLTVSTAPTQSLRDSNTIFTPDNSDTRESNQGSLQGSRLILQVLQLHFQRKQTLQQFMQKIQKNSKNSKCIRATTGLSFLLIHKP